MIDEPKNDPRSRMRSLLDGGNDMKASAQASSPLTRLPKKSVSASPVPAEAAAAPIEERPLQTQASPRPKPAVEPVLQETPSRPRRRQFKFGPAFWTITGTLSLIINIILIAILLSLFLNLRNLQLGSVMNIPPTLLGGLYTNFEKMDRAHIKTSVDVSTNIPVRFDLLLNQQTTVVLSQDVRIENARVSVHTGGLDITNALTTITLPAGVPLPINLGLTVPVDQQVPVTLNVPVDIALKDTDLHEPFTGLQDVVRPLYCMVSPQAVNLDQQAICVKK